MEKIYTTRKKISAYSRVELPKKKGDFVYVLQIGEVKNGRRVVKIGTTNDVRRRMGQLCRHYGENVVVLWVSNPLKKGTTIQVEDKMKNMWRVIAGFQYIPQDRFNIPAEVDNLTVTVRNTYNITLG